MNEKDIVETSKDNNEDISSSKVSDVEEKEENTQEVQTSEPEQQAQTQDYTELVEQVQKKKKIRKKFTRMNYLAVELLSSLAKVTSNRPFFTSTSPSKK